MAVITRERLAADQCRKRRWEMLIEMAATNGMSSNRECREYGMKVLADMALVEERYPLPVPPVKETTA